MSTTLHAVVWHAPEIVDVDLKMYNVLNIVDVVIVATMKIRRTS